jgi:hypothetical protein
VLDRVKAGALGEHPAGENALHLAIELDLVDLDEGGGVWRLGRRPTIADARRHFQRAERHGLIDRNFEMRDAAGHFVERGEHGDRILDLVREGKPRRQGSCHGEDDESEAQKLSHAR